MAFHVSKHFIYLLTHLIFTTPWDSYFYICFTDKGNWGTKRVSNPKITQFLSGRAGNQMSKIYIVQNTDQIPAVLSFARIKASED